MVKIGPIHDEDFSIENLNQEIFPESDEELTKIIKNCRKNKLNFSVQYFLGPMKVTTALTKREIELMDYVVLVLNNDTDLATEGVI